MLTYQIGHTMAERCHETILYFGGKYPCELAQNHEGEHQSQRTLGGVSPAPPACNESWPLEAWNPENGPLPYCTLEKGHGGQHSSENTDGTYRWPQDPAEPITGPIQLRPIDFPEIKKFDEGLLSVEDATDRLGFRASWGDPGRPNEGTFEVPFSDSRTIRGTREAFEFDARTLMSESLNNKIGIAIGAASMAWKERPRGEFDSDYAATIIEAVMAEIEKEAFGYPPKMFPREDGDTVVIGPECFYYNRHVSLADGYPQLICYRGENYVPQDESEDPFLYESESAKDVEPTKETAKEAGMNPGWMKREALEVALRLPVGTSVESVIDAADRVDSYLSNDETRAEIVEANEELGREIEKLRRIAEDLKRENSELRAKNDALSADNRTLASRTLKDWSTSPSMAHNALQQVTSELMQKQAELDELKAKITYLVAPTD